jgi:hypothetical protein
MRLEIFNRTERKINVEFATRRKTRNLKASAWLQLVHNSIEIVEVDPLENAIRKERTVLRTPAETAKNGNDERQLLDFNSAARFDLIGDVDPWRPESFELMLGRLPRHS